MKRCHIKISVHTQICCGWNQNILKCQAKDLTEISKHLHTLCCHVIQQMKYLTRISSHVQRPYLKYQTRDKNFETPSHIVLSRDTINEIPNTNF